MHSLSSSVHFHFPFWDTTVEVFSKRQNAPAWLAMDAVILPTQQVTRPCIPAPVLAAAIPLEMKATLFSPGPTGAQDKMHSPDIPQGVSAALLSCSVSKDFYCFNDCINGSNCIIMPTCIFLPGHKHRLYVWETDG